jgi:uncharacterized protein YfeS
MEEFSSIWDITPDTAHPRAKELLKIPIIWDYGDEDSPLGNDVGADTFAAYLAFRTDHPEGDVEDFLQRQLALRGVADCDWTLIDPTPLQDGLNRRDVLQLLRCDDLIVGLAFAQIILEGLVDPEIRRRALLALRRQQSDFILEFRGGGGEVGRKKQLAEFQRILEMA